MQPSILRIPEARTAQIGIEVMRRHVDEQSGLLQDREVTWMGEGRCAERMLLPEVDQRFHALLHSITLGHSILQVPT